MYLQSSGQELDLRLADAVPSTKAVNLNPLKSLTVRHLMCAQNPCRFALTVHVSGQVGASFETLCCQLCLRFVSTATSVTTTVVSAKCSRPTDHSAAGSVTRSATPLASIPAAMDLQHTLTRSSPNSSSPAFR